MIDSNKYNPKGTLSLAMVAAIMKEFDWSVPYKLIDSTELIESVLIQFPGCEIELSDIVDEGVDIELISYNGGVELGLESSDVIGHIKNYDPRNQLNIEYRKYEDQVEDTKISVRNSIKWIRMYCESLIKGEECYWLESYLAENK